MDQNVLVKPLEIVNLLQAGHKEDTKLVIVVREDLLFQVLLENRVALANRLELLISKERTATVLHGHYCRSAAASIKQGNFAEHVTLVNHLSLCMAIIF